MVPKARVWLARPKVPQVLGSLTGTIAGGLGIETRIDQRLMRVADAF